ncbi:MAG TPA: class I SAM-dependent methyltransferase [Edaphocola sp.]|nr:class I SAM-dependent methyltransferase [Edaphocola sp.]
MQKIFILEMIVVAQKKEWFESWFDSPYHNLLYKKRDDEEAEKLIGNLFKFIKPDPSSSILDIACGDGRHAVIMSKYVKEVIGIDLSERRIDSAKKLEQDNLEFYVQDMRSVFRTNYFDLEVNLFTSFGYFNHFRDNINAANAFATGLKKGGKLVIDYMNAAWVVKNLVHEEIIKEEGITFYIQRKKENDRIIKSIDFKNKEEKAYHFEEKVFAFSKEDFEKIFEQSGLKLIHTFGNYDLDEFNIETSPRLIMIFEK